MENRLSTMIQVVQQAGLVHDVDPKEIELISKEIGENDYEKIAKTIAYIRKRFVEHASRYEAFKYAFPERCVVTEQHPTGSRFDAAHKKIGDTLSKSAIDIKAKRLESTRLYKHIVTTLHTSLHVAYALDRMRVLDYALSKIFDPDVRDRDKVEYMKTFLQETRKPEKVSELELNVNIHNNNVSIQSVEEKLGDIAKKLENMDARSIIEASEVKR